VKVVACAALLVALACASPVPVADEPVDWQAAGEHWSLHIVTVDEDGDERVTRIWLAIVDGSGALRTGDSRWWENLQRTDYPVHAEFVTEHEQKALIDDASVEKYGRMERMMFPQDRGETHDNYARLHRGGAR
jgi:hypothetical protein